MSKYDIAFQIETLEVDEGWVASLFCHVYPASTDISSQHGGPPLRIHLGSSDYDSRGSEEEVIRAVVPVLTDLEEVDEDDE